MYTDWRSEKDKKKYISLEIPKEMWEALNKHTQDITLTNEMFIKELIRKELKM